MADKLISGSGPPNHRVNAEVGTTYLDIDAGVFYYKSWGQGEGDPNGWEQVESTGGGYGN